MELSKAQRAFLSMPSRWPPIMLGIILSLLISAVFTSNFAVRVIPASESTSPTSTISTAPSQLFFFLFRRSYPRGAAPLKDNSSNNNNNNNNNNSGKSEKVYPQPTSNSVNTSSSSSSPYEDIKGDHNAEHNDVQRRNDSLPLEESPPPEKFVHVEGDHNAELNDVQRGNDSLPLEETPPPEKSVDVGSLLGSNVHVNPAPLSNNTHNHSEIIGLKNDTSRSNIAESASLEHYNTTDSIKDVPSSLDSLDKDSNLLQQKKADMAGRPLSTSQRPSPNAKLCDISIGKWVEDDSYPLYRPDTCPFVDESFSCHQNGRPDSKYNRWRWAPRDCIVPRFNGTDLLERLRGKRLVFVGDSLNRNQWESMLCLLRESLPDKRRIVQINGGRISKLPGAYVFKFVDYECKVEFYTSRYLVDMEEVNQTDFMVRLDRMDKSERRWRKANVLVFNTGHWWTPDKIGEGDNRFQEGLTVYKQMDVSVAYGKALSTWAKWVNTYVNPQNTTVFFRGYSPVHYIGGQWNSGGQCQDETEPIFDESFLTPYPSKMQAVEEVLHKVKLPVQVLNITRLSDFRKDAHPATYGHAPDRLVEHQDCSHWCLPGLPDTWNELLYFALVNQASP